ncbi:hypothetical protein OG417_26830 [Actinoallomurus sp. NBC_01490]|nr:hypothetical protein [Actinoallomurus sp. NBC_01490]
MGAHRGVHHGLPAEEQQPGEERHHVQQIDREAGAQQVDEHGRQREPDDDDAARADGIGQAAGDEHADEASDVEDGGEQQRVAGLVPEVTHDLRQPLPDAVDEHQAGERGHRRLRGRYD